MASDLVVVCHRDRDISPFVSFVDISGSIGSLFERIAPIDDGFYLSCFYKLFEEHQIFLPLDRCPGEYFPAAEDRCPCHLKKLFRSAGDCKIESILFE